MTYALDRGLFIESGPAILAASQRSAGAARFRSWRKLNPDGRFELVEKALDAPANDLIDSYPIAL